MTMKLIETITLSSTATLIQFTSIPQTYTDLYVLASLRNNRSSIAEDYAVTFNSDTTSGNYSVREILGSGSSVTSRAGFNYGALTNSNSSTSNTFSSVSVYVPNYTGSSQKNASVDAVVENNATEAYQALTARLWTSTAAITALAISNGDSGGSNSFVSGTTVSLYGIQKGSGGATVA
jgi:hypothetical protein